MTTTPPTKPCRVSECKATATIIFMVGDESIDLCQAHMDAHWHGDRLTLTSGTGVVAAEAEKVVGSDIENDVLTVARGHSNPDGTLTITQIEQTSPAPTAEKSPWASPSSHAATQTSPRKWSDVTGASGQPVMSSDDPAPTPPAATDDEVLALIDRYKDQLDNKPGLTWRELGAALEAHYAVRFERAVGEDSPLEPTPDAQGLSAERKAKWREWSIVENKLRQDARSRYHGETK